MCIVALAVKVPYSCLISVLYSIKSELAAKSQRGALSNLMPRALYGDSGVQAQPLMSDRLDCYAVPSLQIHTPPQPEHSLEILLHEQPFWLISGADDQRECPASGALLLLMAHAAIFLLPSPAGAERAHIQLL